MKCLLLNRCKYILFLLICKERMYEAARQAHESQNSRPLQCDSPWRAAPWAENEPALYRGRPVQGILPEESAGFQRE